MKFEAGGVRLKTLKNEKHDKNMVEVAYVQPGILINSNKKLLIKFNSADDIEELDYFLKTVG